MSVVWGCGSRVQPLPGMCEGALLLSIPACSWRTSKEKLLQGHSRQEGQHPASLTTFLSPESHCGDCICLQHSLTNESN